MCGRYALFEIEALENEYGVPADFEFTPNYNVAPKQTMPVVTDKGIELMRWGLIPRWSKDEKIGYRLINARSESVFDKPVWKAVITKQRCLVPANGFYEWQKREDGKYPFYIHPKEQDLFMFAGVWETWSHEGREWHTYSILTTDSNMKMRQLHDRMPLILHKNDYFQWLTADTPEEIRPSMVPYSDNGIDLYEVGRQVNSVRTNMANLLSPLNS